MIKEKSSSKQRKTLIKQSVGVDQDEMFLELALPKREELLALQRIDLDINPPVLVQLPNDDKATTETSKPYKQARK